MNLQKCLLPLVAVGILTGCDHVMWRKEGATAESFQADKALCQKQAEANGLVGSGSGGAVVDRLVAVRKCMEGKGYTFMSSDNTKLGLD